MEENERVSMLDLIKALYYANSQDYFESESNRINYYNTYCKMPIFLDESHKNFIVIRKDYFILARHVEGELLIKVFFTNKAEYIEINKDDYVIMKEENLFSYADPNDLDFAREFTVPLTQFPEFITTVVENIRSGEIDCREKKRWLKKVQKKKKRK